MSSYALSSSLVAASACAILITSCGRSLEPDNQKSTRTSSRPPDSYADMRASTAVAHRAMAPDSVAVSAIEERVGLFSDILSTISTNRTGKMSAAQFSALLSQSGNEAAVKKACEAVFMKLVGDNEGLKAALLELLTRPTLTDWERNTVHQMIGFVDLRLRDYQALIDRVNQVVGDTPDINMPKVDALLILKGYAYRAQHDMEKYERVLEQIVKVATALGTPYAQQKQAELARLRGEPWEHLDPANARRMAEIRHEKEARERVDLERLGGMSYSERAKVLPLVREQMSRELDKPNLSEEERSTISNLYMRAIGVLEKP